PALPPAPGAPAGAPRGALPVPTPGPRAAGPPAPEGGGLARGGGPDDAGEGPAGGAGRGYGLPAMRARLRQLGGTLTVESAPGEGTVVSASIPLEQQP
ncbi:ATP-binding protein, partial [Kitasatospora sp. NPDC059722]|uniref:ATP-binding protein n=1 Tax=Kitasatospora sp. NPDC059722 TaxID=3346925 RepID=UPI003686ABFA